MTENNQNCSLGMELDLCKTQTKNIQQKFIDYYVQKNFLDKFVTPDKTKLQEAIKIFQTFQEEHFTRGFGVIGFENLVKLQTNKIQFSFQNVSNNFLGQ